MYQTPRHRLWCYTTQDVQYIRRRIILSLRIGQTLMRLLNNHWTASWGPGSALRRSPFYLHHLTGFLAMRYLRFHSRTFRSDRLIQECVHLLRMNAVIWQESKYERDLTVIASLPSSPIRCYHNDQGIPPSVCTRELQELLRILISWFEQKLAMRFLDFDDAVESA